MRKLYAATALGLGLMGCLLAAGCDNRNDQGDAVRNRATREDTTPGGSGRSETTDTTGRITGTPTSDVPVTTRPATSPQMSEVENMDTRPSRETDVPDESRNGREDR